MLINDTSMMSDHESRKQPSFQAVYEKELDVNFALS